MKKKSLLTIVTLLFALVSLTVFTACGNKEEATEEQNPQDVFKTALANIEGTSSMTYEMSMDISTTVDGTKSEAKTTGTIKYIADPLTMEIIMNTDMGEELESMQTVNYAESVDGAFVMYTGMNDTWVKQELGDAAMLQQYDANESLKMYLSSIETFEVVGTEEINGSEVTKYQGAISGDDIQAALSSSGITEMLPEGTDAEALNKMYEDIGEIPVTIWIDNETVMPTAYEMDMSAAVQKMTENILASAESQTVDMTYDKMTTRITVTGYDNVDSITIPEDAKNAQTLEEFTANATNNQ